MAADCLTVLTTVAAHSDRACGIATLVANVGLGHPLPLLRRFANLAVIHGATRVYAGLGAGWSRAEFEALGLPMPPHRARLERLAETARLARTLFDEGWADRGRGPRRTPSTFRSRPRRREPPRLLLGGGPGDILELAARYADHIDLAPPAPPRRDQFQRPLADDDRRAGRIGDASPAPATGT